jgi:hypothetical protein
MDLEGIGRCMLGGVQGDDLPVAGHAAEVAGERRDPATAGWIR